ncbi:hypothetical protein [Lentzea flava]|nr:hypothetical protein [Lentzea flava]MCP2204369.1 hypothetical protein [Lentzea flava]
MNAKSIARAALAALLVGAAGLTAAPVPFAASSPGHEAAHQQPL